MAVRSANSIMDWPESTQTSRTITSLSVTALLPLTVNSNGPPARRAAGRRTSGRFRPPWRPALRRERQPKPLRRARPSPRYGPAVRAARPCDRRAARVASRPRTRRQPGETRARRLAGYGSRMAWLSFYEDRAAEFTGDFHCFVDSPARAADLGKRRGWKLYLKLLAMIRWGALSQWGRRSFSVVCRRVSCIALHWK